jgi:hypothetical protein
MQGIYMQLRQVLTAAAMLLLAASVPMGAARADTVLYNTAGFIEGNQSFVQSFNLSTPGTLTISLSDVPWLDTIADLNCFLTTASGVFGASMSDGSETMKVGAGMIYAHWFGEANGQYGLGVFSLKIMFQPAGSAVPLPGSAILMLSGLGLMVGLQRCRKSGCRFGFSRVQPGRLT